LWYKKPLFFLVLCCSILGLSWFCERQTKGFRYYLLLSNLPNSPAWQTPPLEGEEKAKIDKLLDQPFTFLGRGWWCFAFLGEDQKTVLKLFKHDHLKPEVFFKNPTFTHLQLKAYTSSTLPKHLEEVFQSVLLLYHKMPKETGLLHVHINKTKGEYRTVTLIDPCGIRHTLNLDATEFVLQKKADLVYKHLNKKILEEDIAGAQLAIDQLLHHLLLISQKGIKDTDRCIGFNFGFADEEAMTVDISSFIEDETLTAPINYKKELFLKTVNLNRWLKKHHRPLHRYYVDKLITTIEQSQKNPLEENALP
jgi:hypothetical protein